KERIRVGEAHDEGENQAKAKIGFVIATELTQLRRGLGVVEQPLAFSVEDDDQEEQNDLDARRQAWTAEREVVDGEKLQNHHRDDRKAGEEDVEPARAHVRFVAARFRSRNSLRCRRHSVRPYSVAWWQSKSPAVAVTAGLHRLAWRAVRRAARATTTSRSHRKRPLRIRGSLALARRSCRRGSSGARLGPRAAGCSH